MFTKTDANGFSLEIQSVLKKLFNNENIDFLNQSTTNENKLYTMISSVVPCVCIGETKEGSLFIIIEPLVDDLPDLNSTLDVFNEIIANWLSLYNECVHKRRREVHPE